MRGKPGNWRAGILAIFFCMGAPAAAPSYASWPEALRGGMLERLAKAYPGGLPATIDEWSKFLAATGELNDSFIPFSDAPAFTSLEEARLVASNSPRLFIGAIPRRNGTVDFEFIDWHKSRVDEAGRHVPGEFVFGQIRNLGSRLFGPAPTDPVRVEAVDKAQKCLMCHRTGGPIFTDRPWVGAAAGNAPISLYQSFAMLAKLTQIAPKAYGQWAPLLADVDSELDPDFGDLRGPNAKQLQSIELHGFPLFKFRGVFDFDANVRRATMLLYTDQLLNALPEYRRPLFIASLLRAALKSVVFPGRLEYLFTWRKFLDEQYQAGVSKRARLSARHSPILRDDVPFYDNRELIGKVFGREPFADGAGNIISALIKVSDYLQASGASGFPDLDKPTEESRFVDFDPAWEGNAGWAALDLLADLRKEDIVDLRMRNGDREAEFLHRLESENFMNLMDRGVFPEREELLDVLSGRAVSPGPVEPSVPIESPPDSSTGDRERRLAKGKRRCLTCHGGDMPSAKLMLFNPMDTDEWERALADGGRRVKAVFWRDRIISKLERGRMPPEDSDERKGFNVRDADWRYLIQFLKSHRG